jgi:hypothetical protein
MKIPIAGLGLLLAACAALAQDTWTFEKPYVWSRDAKAITLATEGTVFAVTHTGKQDWSLAGFPRIAVKPGEIFETVCKVKMTTPAEWANAGTGVILRDGKGKELSWVYGGTSAAAPCEWTELKARFIVPKGAASMEPRLVGHGAVSARVEGYAVARAGSVQDRVNPALPPQVALTGAGFSVAVDCATGRFAVTDARTGRTWNQEAAGSEWMVLNAVPTDDKRGVTLTLLNPETTREIRATLTVAKDAPEVGVEIASEGALTQPLDFPSPFETRKGDRLIVPMNEGMGFPVDEEHTGLHRLIAYGGHGICMSFFGVTEDATGAGWMCILETPDDAAMNACRPKGGNWTAGPSWDAQKNMFGYTRKARYVFFGKGGYVAMAKRYRQYAREIGKFVPFTQKVKKVPNIDKLIGAANVWNWDTQDKAALVKEMQSAGMGRILWSAGGSAEDVKALNALPDVLVGRYDIYQDVYYPEQMRKLGWKGKGTNGDAYPQDINWAGPTSNDWRHAWGVKAKDGTWTYCATMCDSRAVPYERRNVTEELKTKPYTARFIDTTVASPWKECWNPAHPMTRSESRFWKMELLRILVDEFHLVCGSETGHDASVPFCDYYEGMLSIGPYRVPDSGRNIPEIWTNVPPETLKYQVGEKYRLPLWELVYHDCVCAHWYWGDYNNKLPDIWHKRDLFNALYGTVPMYIFTTANWKANKARFVASYKIAEPVARSTGYSEMLDHRVLAPDRSVQQSVFANGVTVTVNFGDAPYTTADGRTIPASDLLISGL